jgi:hypothetical protein
MRFPHDMLLRPRRVLIASAAMLMTACGSGSTTPDAGTANVIFVHAIADTSAVDVRVNSRLTAGLSAIPFGTATVYQSIGSGAAVFAVQAAPSTSVDAPRALTNLRGIAIPDGGSLTLVATGQARDTIGSRAAGITAYVDDVSLPAAGRARLRVINASPDAGALDLYLTPQGQAREATPSFGGVDYRSALTRVVLPGTFQFIVTPLGDASTLLATGTVILADGQAKTLIVLGFAGALPAGVSAARRLSVTTAVNRPI